MSRKLTAGIALLVLAAGATAVYAQTELVGDALVRVLVDEIRSLRTTLQRNSAYELRGRLLVDRARLHQETIRDLSREVEASVDFMRPTEADPSWESENAYVEANLETRVAAIPDPEERRKMLERQKKAMEQRKAMEARHREQMRMRFQRMENRLAEEREKLRVVEEELAQMHRELTAASR
jgi:hypothetical protein